MNRYRHDCLPNSSLANTRYYNIYHHNSSKPPLLTLKLLICGSGTRIECELLIHYCHIHINPLFPENPPNRAIQYHYGTDYKRDKPVVSLGAWYSGTRMSRALPLYPRSSAVNMAHFSPMSSAAVHGRSVLCSNSFPELLHLLLYVLQPTLSGQMDRSETLRPLTPWTLRRSSSTPCLTMLLPSLGAMEHVPRECQVVST